jgi:hypothetical protein
MPVRKIKPGRFAITGRYPSIKTQSSHQFESSLERDFLTLLEFDEDVRSYEVQPVTIFYWHTNKQARYTPDIAVYSRYSSILQGMSQQKAYTLRNKI